MGNPTNEQKLSEVSSAMVSAWILMFLDILGVDCIASVGRQTEQPASAHAAARR